MGKLSREDHLEVLSSIDKMTRSQLDDVWDAAIARSKEIKKARTRKLQRILGEGDVVRLARNMKPRYLGEVEAPIKEIVGTKAHLQLPVDPSLRRLSGSICIVPLSAISARISKSSG